MHTRRTAAAARPGLSAGAVYTSAFHPQPAFIVASNAVAGRRLSSVHAGTRGTWQRGCTALRYAFARLADRRAEMRPAVLLLALAAMLPTLAAAARDHYEVLGLKSDSDDGV